MPALDVDVASRGGLGVPRVTWPSSRLRAQSFSTRATLRQVLEAAQGCSPCTHWRRNEGHDSFVWTVGNPGEGKWYADNGEAAEVGGRCVEEKTQAHKRSKGVHASLPGHPCLYQGALRLLPYGTHCMS